MRHLLLVLLPALVSGATSERASQIQYAIGQNVVPVYEGWTRNPDGSATMIFGYMNRNYEEELDIPVGADNRFEPGDADRGQPTHFHVRRQMFVFEVVVPKDWGNKDLVWSLTAHGRTDKAYGSLKPAYELSDVVIRENRLQDMGQGGGEPNTRPDHHARRCRRGEALPCQSRSASPCRSPTTAFRRRGRGAAASGGPPRAAETESASPRRWSSRIRKSGSP